MTDRLPRIRPAVAAKLGFYVYLYVDPRDDKVFYVGKGKGKGGRALARLSAPEKKAIAQRLADLRIARNEARLRSWQTDFRVSVWLPSGPALAHQHDGCPILRSARWEFAGTIAEEQAPSRHVSCNVGLRFSQGVGNSAVYLGDELAGNDTCSHCP